MNVELSENVEHYLIALDYPADVSDAIAFRATQIVARKKTNSGAFLFEFGTLSNTDERHYDFAVSVVYEFFEDTRVVIHLVVREA
jgi:hypothetical protein